MIVNTITGKAFALRRFFRAERKATVVRLTGIRACNRTSVDRPAEQTTSPMQIPPPVQPRDRISLVPSLTPADIDRLSQDEQLRVVQTDGTLPAAMWPTLNRHLFARRPDVQLRVYGFCGLVCDLGFLREMTNVRDFAADCLLEAMSVESIAELVDPQELSLGIYSLESFDVLSSVGAGLRRLSLGATKSRRPDLRVLSRFTELRTLYIEGQSKNIDVIAELRTLQDLTLRGVTSATLDYVSQLPELWSLDIKLGGIRSLDALRGKRSLKYLELWRIRELSDIGVISTLAGLQHLYLQDLPHIGGLPNLDACAALRRVRLESLKSFHDFSSLENAPALEEFILTSGRWQEPEELVPVLRNPRLKSISAWFGSDRKNVRFATLRQQHGKAEWHASPFVYR